MESNWLLNTTIFAALFAVFLACPVHDPKDSRYTLVLSQAILERRSFKLDGYFIQRHEKWPTHFETSHGHRFYFFPPGSSVLSIPFVAIANIAGVSAIRPDRHYDQASEALMQAVIASALMAGFGVFIGALARDLLRGLWWIPVLAGVELGSPIMSTASRTLWSHTWGVFLVGIAVWMLVRLDGNRDRPHPILLATVLTWSYFVRPTNSLPLLGISVYVLVCHRQILWPYMMAVVGWLAAFVAYCWYYFRQLLPSYYQGNQLLTGQPLNGLMANLVSPSRGVLVFVPTLFLVGYLIFRYWRYVPHRRLVLLALGILPVHLAAASLNWEWWAGHSYGPRFMTCMMPWFALLAIVGIRGMLDARSAKTASAPIQRWENAFGAAVLGVSIAMNCYGAISPAADLWNFLPSDFDENPTRVFSARRAQFLAGFWIDPATAHVEK